MIFCISYARYHQGKFSYLNLASILINGWEHKHANRCVNESWNCIELVNGFPSRWIFDISHISLNNHAWVLSFSFDKLKLMTFRLWILRVLLIICLSSLLKISCAGNVSYYLTDAVIERHLYYHYWYWHSAVTRAM